VPGSPQLRQWIAVDAQNGRHVLSIDPAGGSITYGTCRAIDCGAAGAWQSAVIESGPLSPMATGSLTVDAQGRVHATYPMLSTTTLRYATCASDCSVSANWTRTDVDTSANPGLWSAIRSDASGRLHVVYSDWGAGGIRYATCAGACATIDDWASIALPVSLGNVQDIDLAVAGSGRLSIILRGQANNYPVQVAECAAVCLSADEWHVVTLLDSALPSLGNAIAVDVDGVRHVAFQTTSAAVVYATCVRDCSDDAGWQRVTLAMAGEWGIARHRDGTGPTRHRGGSGAARDVPCRVHAGFQLEDEGPRECLGDLRPSSRGDVPGRTAPHRDGDQRNDSIWNSRASGHRAWRGSYPERKLELDVRLSPAPGAPMFSASRLSLSPTLAFAIGAALPGSPRPSSPGRTAERPRVVASRLCPPGPW
jgi:hypothetical protein